jgi:glycosyltransferase involved in cell wall biosynthesis
LAGLALMGARLAGIARQNGWQHIHVHSCADSAHIAMFAHLLSGITYSLTLHGPLVDYGPNQKQKWKHALFAIVITRRLLQEVRSELGSATPELIEVAPMGVEVESFVRTRPYQPWNGSGPCLIFTCGRLNPCKGHDDLIRAVALLREKGIDARLHIAGADDQGGVYRTHLETVARESNLNGHLKLMGAVSEDVVRGELESSHVFSLASLREPLGVAIMEAMAMRVPVVVTGAGGVPELVSDGEDGVLVDPQNPAKLAAALERVLADPRLAERLGDAGRRKVEQGFHSGLSAEVLRRCLGKTLGTGT